MRLPEPARPHSAMPSGYSCTYRARDDDNYVRRRFFPKRGRGCIPVAHIAVHCDVSLARVGLQEHNRDVLFYSCRGGTNGIEVVEEPRKRRMVDTSPRLERLVRLYYPVHKSVINKGRASYTKDEETKDAPKFCR